MNLFNELILAESEKASNKEMSYIHALIDKSYGEWRKKDRRINAVDIITTTANRIIKISPDSIDKLNLEYKAKMAIILMRCMDNPLWKSPETKKKIYEKLYPLIAKLKNFKINTGTGGTLKEIICTRLSANIAMQDKENAGNIIVVYEPKFTEKYNKFLFGSEHIPEKIYRMEILGLPHNFDNLIKELKHNYEKALKKHSSNK